MKITKDSFFKALISRKKEHEVAISQINENGNFLKGKTALITGGSGGIGFAIAEKFLACGCNVIIAGTNESKLANKALSLGGACKWIALNVSNTDDFDSKLKNASMFFGPIDILVCSHGIHTKRQGFDFLSTTEDEFDSVMDVNLKGTYFLCQTMSKQMIDQKVKGHILIISSERALEPSWSAYRISKRGLAELTEGLAQTLSNYGITVNAIGPGSTATTMVGPLVDGSIFTLDNPMGRYVMPKEIAEVAKYLVSEYGIALNGKTIYMSGGSGIITKM
jgi:NAD(P)-dependent dehydrogenase (short-subunit alcohol dehydrogenase family)